MTNNQKQAIINDVTNVFRNKQWFNGAGFMKDATMLGDNTEKLIIAYNYHPALEMKEVKEAMARFPVQYELRDIRSVLPNSQQNDDLPSHMKRN